MRPPRRSIRHRGGNVATLGALMAPALLAAAAFAIDEGALYNERREAQRITDLAAIAASADPKKAGAAALTTFADNGFQNLVLVERRPRTEAELNGISGGSWLLVETGDYSPDPATGAAISELAK